MELGRLIQVLKLQEVVQVLQVQTLFLQLRTLLQLLESLKLPEKLSSSLTTEMSSFLTTAKHLTSTETSFIHPCTGTDSISTTREIRGLELRRLLEVLQLQKA